MSGELIHAGILLGRVLRELPMRGGWRRFVVWVSTGAHFVVSSRLERPTRKQYREAERAQKAPPAATVSTVAIPCDAEGVENEDAPLPRGEVLTHLQELGTRLAWEPGPKAVRRDGR